MTTKYNIVQPKRDNVCSGGNKIKTKTTPAIFAVAAENRAFSVRPVIDL